MSKKHTLLKVATFISIPIIINKLIFYKADKKPRSKHKHNWYEWKFGDIHYNVVGEGKPLLLVHGIGAGCSLAEWEKSIDYLSNHYKVYAIDLLGFGSSDKPAISYSSYMYITLINDFISDIIGESALVAASGNSASFVVAAFNFTKTNFDKLILINPMGAGSTRTINNSNTNFGSKWLKRIIESPILGTSIYNVISSKLFSRYFLQEYCFSDCKHVRGDLIDKYYNSSHFGGVNNKYPIAAFMAELLNVDIERLIKNVTIPIHVIWGEDNHFNPLENLTILEDIKPDMTVSVYENTKLLPHVENSKAFYKETRVFFG